MMSEQDISERNGYLINLIEWLEMGLHILDFPHKPKLISPDYKYELNCCIKNFQVKLLRSDNLEDVFYEFKLKKLEKIEDKYKLRETILEWLVLHEHKRVYALASKDTNLFVTGFNHHNKILKTNPYPVFSHYDPILYKDLERAESTVERFKKYNLKLL